MKIKKAVITAAGRNQTKVPLQVLVDSDGESKSAIRIILEEAFASGVEEACIIVSPGDEEIYRTAAGQVPGKLSFIPQADPRGYGHALLIAQEFVGPHSFLHFVSDHLYISNLENRCAQQLVAIAEAEACSVSAVQPTREGMLPYYGAIGGTRLHHQQNLYTIERVLEKPTPTEAEQSLIVPGLRAGHYLCFFGMHVLSAGVMEILRRHLGELPPGQMLHLAPALAELARKEKYLACEISGRRYNLGVKFGLLNAQIALGLAGNDREELLAQLVELLATRHADHKP
ncbi:MAG: sugar phosphate nucleotidyltransferase [Verrucomicrobiota bacterium]|nr:sugar phosphate nucleotidyltransferase [Verrucomicrobiota bacterium]